MQTEKQNFIEAIKEDKYAELYLNSEKTVYLITDYQFDGTFLPYVGMNDPENWSKEEINELMEKNNIQDIFNWYELEYSESNKVFYPIVVGCEYESIDQSVWE